MQKEEKVIIYKTLRTYMIIYISVTLLLTLIVGEYVVKINNVAMIPVAIFALIKMKEKNLLIIKTIILITIAITSLLLIFSALYVNLK